MLLTSALIFLVAGLLGFWLLTYVLRNKPTRKGLAFLHGAAAVTGLVILIAYAVYTQRQEKHVLSIILFAAAAVGGLVMIFRDLTGRSIPKWLAVGHGLIALTSLTLILIDLLRHPDAMG